MSGTFVFTLIGIIGMLVWGIVIIWGIVSIIYVARQNNLTLSGFIEETRNYFQKKFKKWGE